MVTTDDEEIVDRRALRQNFWTGLQDYRSDIDGAVTAFEPRPYRALRLTSGIRHIGLEMRYVLQPQKVAVDLYFWRAASHPVQELPDALACRIGLFRWDSPLDDESRWNEYFDWMSDRVIRLEAVFRPVVRVLP